MRWSIVVLVVACGSNPPPPTIAPEPARIPVGTRIRGVPRPPIALPELVLRRLSPADLDPDDVRWPLARHPNVEPHAELSAIFRGSGTWRTLCTARNEPRWVDRDEALAYLDAWCAHQSDVTTTRRKLAPLAKAKSQKLAKAGRADLVDLLAFDTTSGKDAVAWLHAIHLADIDQLDALAAAYQAVDRHEDAAAVATELRGFRPAGPPADHCRRLLRDHVVTGRWVSAELDRLKPDPTCTRIKSQVRSVPSSGACPLVTQRWPADVCARRGCEEIVDQMIMRCGALLQRSQFEAAHLVAAYQTWPIAERRAAIWIEHARFTSHAIGLPGAVDLVAAALENAALLANCTTELPAILELARTALSKTPTHRVLAFLVALTPTTCEKRFSPSLDRRT